MTNLKILTGAVALLGAVTVAAVATPVTNNPAFAASMPEGNGNVAVASYTQPQCNANGYATASYERPQGNTNGYATASYAEPQGNGNVTFASYAQPQGNSNGYATASYADPETHHGVSTANTAAV